MGKTRFICYGESIDNLRLTVEYNIIGVPKRFNFEKCETVYIVLKIDGKWNICGRAKIGEETDLNPFERYYTYTIIDFEACMPFSINEKCREYLGSYWGLIFQRPALIENHQLISFSNESFCQVSSVEMLKEAEKMK